MSNSSLAAGSPAALRASIHAFRASPRPASLGAATNREELRATLAARSYADAQAERDPEAFVARRIAEFRENQPSMAERMVTNLGFMVSSRDCAALRNIERIPSYRSAAARSYRAIR